MMRCGRVWRAPASLTTKICDLQLTQIEQTCCWAPSHTTYARMMSEIYRLLLVYWLAWVWNLQVVGHFINWFAGCCWWWRQQNPPTNNLEKSLVTMMVFSSESCTHGSFLPRWMPLQHRLQNWSLLDCKWSSHFSRQVVCYHIRQLIIFLLKREENTHRKKKIGDVGVCNELTQTFCDCWYHTSVYTCIRVIRVKLWMIAGGLKLQVVGICRLLDIIARISLGMMGDDIRKAWKPRQSSDYCSSVVFCRYRRLVVLSFQKESSRNIRMSTVDVINGVSFPSLLPIELRSVVQLATTCTIQYTYTTIYTVYVLTPTDGGTSYTEQ